MDRANPSADTVQPGISLRYGPLEEMDVDELPTKGMQTNSNVTGKRKARQGLSNGTTYKEASSDEEDDKPLVCLGEQSTTARIRNRADSLVEQASSHFNRQG